MMDHSQAQVWALEVCHQWEECLLWEALAACHQWEECLLWEVLVVCHRWVVQVECHQWEVQVACHQICHLAWKEWPSK